MCDLDNFLNGLYDCVSGETFILYNQQVKGSKRELIQLGAPIFGHVKEDTTCQKSKK